jgi:cytochrome d ubiquinol oxidase subunit I
LKALIPAAILPYLGVSTGWIIAETGRWPWIVFGLQKVEQAVSPNVPAWNVALSLVLFVGLYAVLGVIAFNLAVKTGTGSIEGAHGAMPKSAAAD